MAGVLLLLACGSTAEARAPGRSELRAIALQGRSHGASVVLELSQPTAPRLTSVRGDDGALARIQVDLAPGTAIGGRARALRGDGPVTGVRVGLLDAGRPRVVIDLDGATGYRLERNVARGTLTIVVLADGPPTTTAAPARTPARATAARGRAAVRPRIVLDPGHGGDDPGAAGFAVEKDVTLDIAQRVADLLRTRLEADVILTRTDDATLALKERTARANAESADLFVSIHANANPTGQLHGVETYYLDTSTDHATLRLAEMENGLDLLRPTAGATGLRYILSDLVQVGKLGESASLARHVQESLVARLRRHHDEVTDLGVKRGPFYVLVGAYMPCVLVETAFLTHPVEGRRLAQEDYRAEIAEGLYTGIAGFLADGRGRRTL